MIAFLYLTVVDRARALSAAPFLVVNEFFVLVQKALFELIIALLVLALVLLRNLTGVLHLLVCVCCCALKDCMRRTMVLHVRAFDGIVARGDEFTLIAS